ncbi:MAG: SOS response-associated peptidase, partial [Bradymonadaceae bacterium]
MCGRFTLNTTGREIAVQFDLDAELEIPARYNIAPTDDSPIVRLPDMAAPREASFLRWGLVPFWADDPSIGNRMINARAETVPDKPSFRAAFKKRRCVVPASGFYEWKKTEDGKQPYYIRHADEQVLGFAGLWERWTDDHSGEVVESFTILTGEPNDLVAD